MCISHVMWYVVCTCSSCSACVFVGGGEYVHVLHACGMFANGCVVHVCACVLLYVVHAYLYVWGGCGWGCVSVCVCVCVCGVCLGLALAFCIPAWPCARSFLLRKHLLNCPAEKQTDASPPEIHLPHQLHESRIVPHPARGPPEVEPLLKGLRLVSGGTRIQTWVF